MNNIVKVRIDHITYQRVVDITVCDIDYSILVDGKVISKFSTFGKTSCGVEDVFDKTFGKDLSRAYAELKIYKYVLLIYASQMVYNDLYNHFNLDYNKTLTCMINTRKYYKTLIKKQYKYINSFKHNETH